MNALGITSIVFTLVITVVILLVVFKMVSGSMGDKEVLQSGVPGTAVIMSLSPTGTVINEMYYVCNIGLRVTLPAQAPYDVMIKQSVAITSMAAANPGNTVGVKVDPTDNTKVAIDWSAPVAPMTMGASVPGPAVATNAAQVAAAVAQTVAAGGMAQSGIVTTSTADLLRSGQRVLGVLTEYADTGNTPRSLNMTPSKPEFIDDPMYVLSLQLHVAENTQIDSQVMHRVPRAMVPQLKLGLQLNCAVDPANPSRAVAVDWGDLT